uniref:Orf1 n=1 Tax=Azotobacter vinelandii TaxID=354 RepID=Q44477_AZOVI|nr:orf1 [Azotobacter vinelandii]
MFELPELNDVSFHLAGRRLLQQISLQLPQGQTVGLIGHNGSGKSTLVKLLARQLEPTGGRLRLDGRPLNEWPEREFARHVAYLPQRLPAVENLTVRELVGFGRYPWHGPLGRFGADDRLHVERALELTGAAGFAERPAERLSDGERQRVWLAMLLEAEHSLFCHCSGLSPSGLECRPAPCIAPSASRSAANWSRSGWNSRSRAAPARLASSRRSSGESQEVGKAGDAKRQRGARSSRVQKAWAFCRLSSRWRASSSSAT